MKCIAFKLDGKVKAVVIQGTPEEFQAMGYDDKNIRAVFNLRKTRSKRLYAQIVGRGLE